MEPVEPERLGRCLAEPACPCRYPDGRDRAACLMHQDTGGDLAKRAAEYGTLMDAPQTAQATGRVIRGTGRQ